MMEYCLIDDTGSIMENNIRESEARGRKKEWTKCGETKRNGDFYLGDMRWADSCWWCVHATRIRWIRSTEPSMNCTWTTTGTDIFFWFMDGHGQKIYPYFFSFSIKFVRKSKKTGFRFKENLCLLKLRWNRCRKDWCFRQLDSCKIKKIRLLS